MRPMPRQAVSVIASHMCAECHVQRISADVPPWWAALSSSCGTLANTGWRLTAAVVFICATQLQAKTPRRDPNLRQAEQAQEG